MTGMVKVLPWSNTCYYVVTGMVKVPPCSDTDMVNCYHVVTGMVKVIPCSATYTVKMLPCSDTCMVHLKFKQWLSPLPIDLHCRKWQPFHLHYVAYIFLTQDKDRRNLWAHCPQWNTLCVSTHMLTQFTTKTSQGTKPKFTPIKPRLG